MGSVSINGDPTSSRSPAASHKNEGFLKSAWHKLTHQHDNLTPDEPGEQPETEERSQEEEPKKATGSG